MSPVRLLEWAIASLVAFVVATLIMAFLVAISLDLVKRARKRLGKPVTELRQRNRL